MRILSFSKKWSKLNQPEFTTFRFRRKGKDWEVGEYVKIVYKPRSKDQEILGIGEIIAKEARWMGVHPQRTDIPEITEQEAIEDGFKGKLPARMLMHVWLAHTYGKSRVKIRGQIYYGYRFELEPMNKLILKRR